MKKLHLFALLFCVAEVKAQTSGDAFILAGKVTGSYNGKLKLYYTGKGQKAFKDSCLVKNGTFVFKGFVSEPAMAFLEEEKAGRISDELGSTRFFIEPAAMTISFDGDDLQHAVVTGSKSQDELVALEKSYNPIYNEMKPLEADSQKALEEYDQAVKNKSTDAVLDSLKGKINLIHAQFEPYFSRIAVLNYQFMESHPNSYVTAFVLQLYSEQLPLDSLQMFYNRMDTTLKQSAFGKSIHSEMEKLRSGSPGSVAKNFTAIDINGHNLTLSQFKGKYILIDFWASWCVPCRRSSPHILALYKKYHKEGLEIIGVADDDYKPSEWKKAVKKDQVDVWHHVLRGYNSKKNTSGQTNQKDISEKFGIHSLPTKILIDKNGVIIGRYDKGTEEESAEMDRKIAEIFLPVIPSQN